MIEGFLPYYTQMGPMDAAFCCGNTYADEIFEFHAPRHAWVKKTCMVGDVPDCMMFRHEIVIEAQRVPRIIGQPIVMYEKAFAMVKYRVGVPCA